MRAERVLSAFLLAVLLGGAACAQVVPSRRSARPDVVVFMADDLGWADLACYGGEVPTPNIDRLAKEGVRFTQFYNAGRCCPTRASLLTGRYAHAVGLGWMTAADEGVPGYRGRLDPAAETFAERARASGYQSAMVGKWHVSSSKASKSGPDGTWPTQRGFERFYGSIEGAKDYFAPKYLYEDLEPVEAHAPGGERYFYTRAITERAVRFVESAKPDPLLLYVAFYAPHFPLQAPKATIAKYRGAYAKGWDELRAARFARQKRMGLIGQKVELSPRPSSIPAWADVKAEKRALLERRMEVYAAQIEELDRGVGRVLDALEERGRLDDTVIVFLSDNGATARGQRFGTGRLRDDASFDSKSSYGSGWAHVSCTPFRRFKSWAHEGGVRAPLIVRWPSGGATPGALRHQPCHVIDVFPTIAELTREPGTSAAPANNAAAAGRDRGESLVSLLRQDGSKSRDFFFEHETRRAVRSGSWKLVAAGKKAPWELYDMVADPTEMKDLAAIQVERAERLAALWQAWAERNGVVPLRRGSWGQRTRRAKKRSKRVPENDAMPGEERLRR